jgi:hypothetical protein
MTQRLWAALKFAILFAVFIAVAFRVAQLFPVGVGHSPATKGSPLVFAAVLGAEIFLLAVWELTAPPSLAGDGMAAALAMWLWGRRKKILFFSSAVLAVCAIAAAVWEDREKVWEDREKAKKANDLAMEEARAEMCRKGRTIDAPGEVNMISLSSATMYLTAPRFCENMISSLGDNHVRPDQSGLH